ncbi:hypothetical protein N8294_02880 [Polaribacter sp.]|jgi:hypothetical protein|nr:hypothetical protein [Polaribacter sp.]
MKNTYKQIIEIISSLAIVLSVIFLALEVNQSNQLAKSTIRQALNVSDMEIWKVQMEEDVIAKSLHKIKKDIKLTDYEEYQVILFQNFNFRDFDNSFYQYRNGLFEKDVWLAYRRIISDLLEDKYVMQMWNKHYSQFTTEFQKEIGIILNEKKINS